MCCLKCLVIRNTVSSFLKKLMLHLISPSGILTKNVCLGTSRTLRWSSFFCSYFSYIVLLCCLCFCLWRINVSFSEILHVYSQQNSLWNLSLEANCTMQHRPPSRSIGYSQEKAYTLVNVGVRYWKHLWLTSQKGSYRSRCHSKVNVYFILMSDCRPWTSTKRTR